MFEGGGTSGTASIRVSFGTGSGRLLSNVVTVTLYGPATAATDADAGTLRRVGNYVGAPTLSSTVSINVTDADGIASPRAPTVTTPDTSSWTTGDGSINFVDDTVATYTVEVTASTEAATRTPTGVHTFSISARRW